MSSPLQIAILLSGRGSNFQAILNNCLNGTLNATISCVFSNKPEAKGLETATANQIDTIAISPNDFPNFDDYEKAVLTELQKYPIDLVVCAGYMRILGPTLLNAFPNKIINIHPSLLPKFKGLNAQKQALEAGETEAGCTVHYVNDELDGGPIILQKKVPVLENDTVESLSDRILEQEHIAYSEAIQQLINQGG